ncbi:MAG: 5'/3'-nucleotidase SurE [Myxococcales bacterium]|nr:5'/3'-nucleotidase SurE [Myxococcales bacterium]MCB9543210.1 5'/3'-nucleotidase SurE [Myxococcales bacterium]MCB9553671.1 5'/3'-nucleotidase SurE [Myxococcales bacterium]
MSRPVVLVTNDDGIDSFFLALLVEGLRARFEVRVVAPRREQSWTGRAFTRRAAVAVEAVDSLGVPAWWVDGTPSDCVNIGLALLDAPPAAVVSGINLGFNVSLPLVLSSGTIAAATEGALAGLHAVALSHTVASEHFEAVWKTGGRGDARLEASVRAAAARAGAFVEQLIGAPAPGSPVVHSLNFPGETTGETPMERTRLAPIRLGGCFVMGEDRAWRFRFPRASIQAQVEADTDLACVMRGHISHSVLDFAALGGFSGVG